MLFGNLVGISWHKLHTVFPASSQLNRRNQVHTFFVFLLRASCIFIFYQKFINMHITRIKRCVGSVTTKMVNIETPVWVAAYQSHQ